MNPVLQLVLELIAGITAIANGATAVREPSPAQMRVIQQDDPNIAVVTEYESPRWRCTFKDEPCYIIIYRDLTIELGP